MGVVGREGLVERWMRVVIFCALVVRVVPFHRTLLEVVGICKALSRKPHRMMNGKRIMDR